MAVKFSMKKKNCEHFLSHGLQSFHDKHQVIMSIVITQYQINRVKSGREMKSKFNFL